MKKITIISILFLMITSIYTIVANAATAADLPNRLYAIGARYDAAWASARKVEIERYIKENTITDAEADRIIADAQAAAKIVDEAGVTSYDQLSSAQKERIKNLALDAADAAGATITFSNGTYSIIDQNGKVVDSGSLPTMTSTGKASNAKTGTASSGSKTTRKLVYTGNDSRVLLIGASTAGLALVSIIVRKKIVSA